jgi:hypothetical protein
VESDMGNAVTHRHNPYFGYGATIASTQYPDASVPHRRYRYSVDFDKVRIPAKTATYSGNNFTTYTLIQFPC